MTRNFLLIALGALIMFVLLKIMAKNSSSSSATTERFKNLAKTQQAVNLVKTNEFRELIKTKEFFSLVASLAKDEMTATSQLLTNTTKIV